MYYFINDYVNKRIFINKNEYLKLTYKPNNTPFDKINALNRKKNILKFYLFLFILLIICLSYFFHLLKNQFKIHYSQEINDQKNLENYLSFCENGQLINPLNFTKRVENPKISIISPVYNREKYILRFLRSIQNQFFPEIEIILVDDSSKDNSVKLIEKYQEEDGRIILIKNKVNRGTLISRNEGILYSRGEYIMISDIDDILSENILFNCYQLAKLHNYEIIRFNIYIGNNTIFFNKIVSNLKSEAIYQPKLSSYIFYGLGYLKQIDFNLSNKLIKREAFIRMLNSMNEYYLKQHMTNMEDGLINFMLYRTAKSFYYYKKVGYYYIQNNQSITLQKKKETYDYRTKFIFLNWKMIVENTKNNEYEKNMANALIKRLHGFLNNLQYITKDYKFYKDSIDMLLKCKYINGEARTILDRLKNSLIKVKT